MKRRNLFLSLISSVLVAVAIVTVTIVTVIQPKKKNEQGGQVVTPIVDVNDIQKYENMNEFERNGSEEYPYVIYSADSFIDMLTKFGGSKRLVTKPATEMVEVDGELVETVKKDSNGYVIFEKVVDENGNDVYDVYNFELVSSIDFSETNYKTLFNNGSSFIANIDGNDFSLMNISINVTKDNLESDFSYAFAGKKYAKIALFGDMNGSTLKDLNISGLNVNVATDVYDYISNETYNLFAEMVVASLAGTANNVTLSNVDIEARVAGTSYVNIPALNQANQSIDNAVGGVVAVAGLRNYEAGSDDFGLKMLDSKVNVEIEANSGRNYLVGAIAGYGMRVEVNNSEINSNVKTSYARSVDVAGMFAYAKDFTASNVDVNLEVSETASAEERNAYVNKITTNANGDEVLAHANDMNMIAGLVVVLRANDSTQETTLSNINVNSKVDFDGLFAGAIFDVYSKNKSTFGLVELHNVFVTANVNVLAMHAFARQLVATSITYDAPTSDDYCNIKLTGNVKFEDYAGTIEVYNVLTENYDSQEITYQAATMILATKIKYSDFSYKDLYVQASASINSAFEKSIVAISISGNVFGSYEVV